MTSPLQLDKKRLNNPAFGAACALKGLALLTKQGLRRYVAVPIALNVVLYSLGFWLAYIYVSDLIDRLIPGWLEWLSWFIWPLFLVTFLLAAFFTFTLAANLLMAPFYGKLAEKAEKLLAGEAPANSANHSLTREIARTMTAELQRLGYFFLGAVPLLILFIIPGVNLVAPFAWAVFSAWVLALEYTAYPLENRGVLFPEQRKMVKGIRWGFLSFGALVMLGLTLPVLNILVPPAAVLGATAYFSDRKPRL